MQRMFEDRIRRMDLPNYQLENKYGLINSSGNQLEIHASQQKENENNILLTTRFLKKKKAVNILAFPVEINDIIASYCDEFINLTMQISHPQDYPFVPPIWSLINVQDNVNSLLNIPEYYEYKIETHNSQYRDYWSPATDIEKDILDFIQKINHFDYLLEYK